MKLVLVGWLSALISFGIGYALGRRGRRRDMIRDAMFNATASLAAYSMAQGAGVHRVGVHRCSARHDITTKGEGPHTLRCTRERDHDGDHFNGGVKWVDLDAPDELELDDEAWSERNHEGKKP